MRNRIVLPAALIGVGLAGGIGGAAAWEAVVTDDGTPAASVASPFSQGISTASTDLTLAELYRRAAPGVVEITTRAQGTDVSGRRRKVAPLDPGSSSTSRATSSRTTT